MAPASGPTVLGIDVVMVATGLAAVATFAVLVAIYAATTVRDPMAKRVKALNERREQLKAGIVASSSKRRRRSATRTKRPTRSAARSIR
jgi:tight adherence protein C